MKKTYWWRILCSTLLLIAAGGSIFYDTYICFPDGTGDCPFVTYRNYFLDPVVFFSAALFFISPLLFFVSDVVFKKWLRFALVWLAFSAVFITLAPVHSGGLITGYRLTKGYVSILMSVLFVPISLLVLFLTARGKRK